MWRLLLRYGAMPDPNRAAQEAQRQWPDPLQRRERLAELQDWAGSIEGRYREEASQIATGRRKATPAYREMREAFGRAFAAIASLTG